MSSLLQRSDLKVFFKGRKGDPRLGECVKLLEGDFQKAGADSLVIWGVPDDLGVQRNLGRVGAKEGPKSIREYFYKICPPATRPDVETWMDFWDAGDVVVSDQIQKTHQGIEEASASLAHTTQVVLGGGHDIAAPNYLGFLKGFGAKPKEVGLINIDPHLDVRPSEDGLPHSGTPFRQILESHPDTHLLQFGCREGRNSKEAWDFCLKNRVQMVPWEEICEETKSPAKVFESLLKKISSAKKAVVVNFDIDACSELEGCSAPTVLGFSAKELCQMAYAAGQCKNVKIILIAEVAPSLDPTKRSSRIAAEIMYAFMGGRACALALSERAKNSKKLKKNAKK